VRVLARRVRSKIEERFPDIEVIDSTTGPFYDVVIQTTIFVVRGSSVSEAERSRATLKSLLGDAALAWGLKADPRPLRYHSGDGFEPEYSSLIIEPVLDQRGMLLVKVIGRSASSDPSLLRVVADALEARLDAAFGPDNVTRHFSSLPLEAFY
jgi:hypothetical protein